jgi:hypothetical protein
MNYNEKKRLIKEGAKFAREELGFQFRRSCLRMRRNPHYAVYAGDSSLCIPSEEWEVSEKGEKVSEVESFRTPFFAGRFRESLERGGLDTMLYTVHASNRGLSKSLLDFSPEGIVQVLFHEIFHGHLKEKSPYTLIKDEESLADAMGYLCGIEFSKLNGQLDTDSLVKSENTFEKVSLFLKQCIDRVKRGEISEEFYTTSGKTLRKFLPDFDDYQRQRFDYEFNNAFLVRYRDYCYNYPESKKLVLQYGNLARFVREGIAWLLPSTDPDF